MSRASWASVVGCALALSAASGCGDDDAIDDAVEVDGGAAGWESLPDVGEGPVQEIGVAELDGKIYVVGGFGESLQLVDDVQMFDPNANEWSLAAPLPQPVHHANVAVVSGKLYVVGAMTLNGVNFVPLGNVWEYDPTLNEWVDKAPMPAGTERGASAVGVVDDIIYIAGGSGAGGSVDDFSSYNPADNQWDSTLPPLPEARDHLVGAGVGGTFFAIGGRNGGIAALRGSVDAYQPGGSWQSKAPMLTPRGGAGGGVVNGNIIVVGGEGNTAITSGVFAKAELYDPDTDQWHTLSDMRTPRHGMGAAGLGDKLFVPGGATTQGFGAVATHEVLTIASQ